MKVAFLTISIITAILAVGFTLAGLYIAWDVVFVQIGLAMIGAGAVSGLLSIASLLVVILLKITGKP